MLGALWGGMVAIHAEHIRYGIIYMHVIQGVVISTALESRQAGTRRHLQDRGLRSYQYCAVVCMVACVVFCILAHRL